MNPETRKAWAPLKNALDNSALDYFRLEAKEPMGICDLNILMQVDSSYQDIWVELKAQTETPAGKINWGLRKEQYIWMRAAKLAGREVFLLGVHGGKWFLFDKTDHFKSAKAPWNYQKMCAAAIVCAGPNHVIATMHRILL